MCRPLVVYEIQCKLSEKSHCVQLLYRSGNIHSQAINLVCAYSLYSLIFSLQGVFQKRSRTSIHCRLIYFVQGKKSFDSHFVHAEIFICAVQYLTMRPSQFQQYMYQKWLRCPGVLHCHCSLPLCSNVGCTT